MLTKFTIFLFSIQIIYPQNVSNLIQPICTNKKVEYSILVDMKKYLENEKNIDGREFYSTIDDLKSKNPKVGTLSFITLVGFTNVEKYNNLEDLLEALKKHKVDAIFIESSFANFTQINSIDLSMIPGEEKSINVIYYVEKNSEIYQKLVEFQNFSKGKGKYLETYYKWMGINEDGYYVNKTLTRNNGVLKALLFNYPPFSFIDEKGDLVGSGVSFLYGFCFYIGYQLDLKIANSIDELDQAINNKSFDIVNYFIQDKDKNLSEYSILSLSESKIVPIIRYSNHPNSISWDIYDSIEQIDGKPLGCLKGYSFQNVYKEKFSNSEITYYDNDFDSLYYLLLEDIEGYMTDETIAKNNLQKFPDRISYFDMNITNELGFGFKKNDTTLLNEFNQFLEKQDVEKIYEKWNVKDTLDIKVEKENYNGVKTIKVGLLTDSRPFCFRENDDIKGIEVDLIYQFAKSKNYNIELIEFMNTEDRMKIGESNTDLDMTGGQFTITEERSRTVAFSNPIYKVKTSLVVRRDSKKDNIKLTILDNEYNQIPDKNAKLISKVGNKTVTSLCAFPDVFNYSLTLKCSINDLNGTDPFTQGIESTTTEDKLQIEYSYLEIDNIIKGNEKLKLPIIQESDKTEHICSEEDRVQESSISPLISVVESVAGAAAIFGLLFTLLIFCF